MTRPTDAPLADALAGDDGMSMAELMFTCEPCEHCGYPDCEEHPEPTCADCGADWPAFEGEHGERCADCEAADEDAAIEAERHAAEAVAAWFAAEAEAHKIERELRCERAMWAAHDAFRLRSE